MSVYPLTGVVRPYAWGSRTVIAALQGRPVPSDGPEAELWLGAHPGDPSTVAAPEGPVSLAALIADDPKGRLGAAVVDEFGVRLPYLMKVLAAAAPLSLQAHPDAEYARRAYAAQEADPAAPRNYTDAYHKPEMLVALSPFEALCGFRDPVESADVLAGLPVPELAPVVAALRTGVDGLAEAVRTLLTWPAGDRPALVEAAAEHGPRLAADLAEHHPGDPGVVVALLLNHVRLAPGEAIWMPAGNMHAYLDGSGVEIMAASDNVLRGGLTPKRVDVDELLRVLRFEVLDDPVLPATPVAPGVVTWRVPAREFELYRIDLDGRRPPTQVPGSGPRIVLGVRGDVVVGESHGTAAEARAGEGAGTAAVHGTPAAAGAGDGHATPVEVTAGKAAFVPADTGPVTVAGVGEVFVATVPAD